MIIYSTGNHCLNTYNLLSVKLLYLLKRRKQNKRNYKKEKIIEVAENVHLTFNQANSVHFKYTKLYHTTNLLTEQLKLIFKG